MATLTVRSHFFNALLPGFLKHLFWNSLFFLVFYWLYSVIADFYGVMSTQPILYWGLFFVVIVSLLMMAKEFINVYFSWFTFYDDRVQANFKLFTETTHSVNYAHITNIKVEKNLWDRICGVGDIIIYTSKNSGDGTPNHFTLSDVKSPEVLKERILKKITAATHHRTRNH